MRELQKTFQLRLENDRGFSLIGVLAGLAGAGALTMAILKIAQLSSSINALMVEGGELQNQVYIAKTLLSDSNTCRLNLSGIEVGSERVRVNRVLRQKNAAGTALGEGPIFPDMEINRVQNIYLRPMVGVSQIVLLDVEFSRNRIFGDNQSLQRSIPLRVTKTGNRIENCTAGEGLLDIAPDQEPGDPSLPAIATFGNCDNSSVPGGTPNASLQTWLENGRNRLCDRQTYPIDSEGSINCGSESISNSDGAAFYDRYGCTRTKTYSLGVISTSSTVAGNMKNPRFAGIRTAGDCKRLPLSPQGSYAVGSAGTTTSIDMVCINGSWVFQD